MVKFSRSRQETGSYCGPAVLQMLASVYGVELNQEEIVEACGVRQSVMREGISLRVLAHGLAKLRADLRVWVKCDAKVEDISKLLEKGYLVGVDWQGIFAGDEYGDDEVDPWWRGWLRKDPELEGDQGHYCVVLEVNTKKGYVRFADPYGHYAKRDRFVAIWEFEERWWDDRLESLDGGRVRIDEERQMFVVVKKGDKFPRLLGMELA